MTKVTVSLPDDVLRALNVEAECRGTTRSGLVRELVEDAVARRARRRAERMAEIRASGGPGRHGGHVAQVFTANRPQ